VFCFEGAQMRTLRTDPGLPGNETQRSMAVDGAGGLWVSYTSGNLSVVTPTAPWRRSPQRRAAQWRWRLLAGQRTGWNALVRQGSRVGVFATAASTCWKNFGSAALQITPTREGGNLVCVDQRVLKFDPGVETVELGKIVPAEARDRQGLSPRCCWRIGRGQFGSERSLLVCTGVTAMPIVRVEVSNPGILSLTEDREGTSGWAHGAVD